MTIYGHSNKPKYKKMMDFTDFYNNFQIVLGQAIFAIKYLTIFSQFHKDISTSCKYMVL